MYRVYPTLVVLSTWNVRRPRENRGNSIFGDLRYKQRIRSISAFDICLQRYIEILSECGKFNSIDITVFNLKDHYLRRICLIIFIFCSFCSYFFKLNSIIKI